MKSRACAKLNPQSSNVSALEVLKRSLREEGPAFLFKGWTPAFIRLGPNTVLMFVFFEVRVPPRHGCHTAYRRFSAATEEGLANPLPRADRMIDRFCSGQGLFLTRGTVQPLRLLAWIHYLCYPLSHVMLMYNAISTDTCRCLSQCAACSCLLQGVGVFKWILLPHPRTFASPTRSQRALVSTRVAICHRPRADSSVLRFIVATLF